MPLVLLGEHDFDGQFDHVAIDNVQAAADATRHLLDIGRTRIAAIGAQPLESYATPRQRTAGWESTLRDAGLVAPPEFARAAEHYSRGEGYAATRALLSLPTPPDAILCFSDLLAIGAIRAVFDAGLAVPDDVAIIGIDDIEEGHFLRPSLSTISLDTPFIAREAIARVTARIEDPTMPAEQVVAPHQLVPRESTAS